MAHTTRLEKFLDKQPIVAYLIYWLLIVVFWRVFGFESTVVVLLAGNVYENAKLGVRLRAQGKEEHGEKNTGRNS